MTVEERKGRTVRFRLAAAFITVALLSVLIVGAINFLAARQLLENGVEQKLSAVGEARARSIELGVGQIRAEVQAIAADGALADALGDLSASFEELEAEELASDDEAALTNFYEEEVLTPLREIGVDEFEVSDLTPNTDAGRYLQFHYVIQRRADGIAAAEFLDAGDGSAYSAAHARHHPFLTGLNSTLAGDLLLIDSSGSIVYSTDKRLDFGTSLEAGPYQNSKLATAVLDGLPQASSRDAVLADWQMYLPAAGKPTLFVVAAVRSDTTTIGAVALEIPAPALSAVTTAGGDWASVGLPTGESYVVGPDLRLSSESRLWLEDPGRYLELTDPETTSLIETFGSPVGIQLVDTEPARAALGGERFEGSASNYLGEDTFSSAIPLDIDDVSWVVVVDTPLSETRAGLFAFVRRMGLLLAVLVPIAGLIGFLFASRFARSTPPLVEAAKSVADGERDPVVSVGGGGELTDLGQRLEHVAHELARQERDLEDEYERRRDLLLSVLPARLVNHQGEVGDEVEPVRRATAIAIGIHVSGDATSGDIARVALDGRLRDELLAAGEELNIEPVRLAADRSLFITGGGSDSVDADKALRFAAAVVASAANFDDEHQVKHTVRIGLASGAVATGILETGTLMFAAWGEPVRRALAIGALAQADDILVDQTTVDELHDDGWELERAPDVISLDGEPLDVMRFSPADLPVQ
ncbi:MAG: adenylate/guanylate cyclase domain-containing protein [Acidimicrobiales bacterium]